MPFFESAYQLAETVVAGDRQIYPIMRSFKVRLPGMGSVFTWKTPVMVLIKGPDGTSQEMPVRDITREIQILLLVSVVLTTLYAITNR